MFSVIMGRAVNVYVVGNAGVEIRRGAPGVKKCFLIVESQAGHG